MCCISFQGYALFEVTLQEEIAAKSKAVQDSISDQAKFLKMVKIKSYLPFTSGKPKRKPVSL